MHYNGIGSIIDLKMKKKVKTTVYIREYKDQTLFPLL